MNGEWDAAQKLPSPPDTASTGDMSAVRAFVAEFWPVFVVSAVVFPLLWLGRAISLDGAPSFVSRRDFSELAAFSKEDQKRLLQDARRKAFPAWRLSILAFMYAAVLSVSLAAGRVLTKTGLIQDSFWMSTGASLLLLGLGWWGLRLAEVRRVRKFLAEQVEKAASGMRGDQ